MNILQHLAKTDRSAFNAARREMQKEARSRPKVLTEIDISSIPTKGQKPLKSWVSNKFLVQLYQEEKAQRLSISKTEIDNQGNWIDGITWDEIQAIKNELGFHNCWAVEVYPPIDKVVNVANIRHIFLMNSKPEYAWGNDSALAD